MYFPSRDQSVAKTRPSVLLTSGFSSPWPVEAFSTRLDVPSFSAVNTIREPSGDHRGQMLTPAANVKREFTPRARSRTQTSNFPLRGSEALNARRSPARDNDGF